MVSGLSAQVSGCRRLFYLLAAENERGRKYGAKTLVLCFGKDRLGKTRLHTSAPQIRQFTMTRIFSVALTTLLLTPHVIRAADWTEFRGPGGQGHAEVNNLQIVIVHVLGYVQCFK